MTFKRSIRKALERKARLLFDQLRRASYRREELHLALKARDDVISKITESIDDYLARVKARFDYCQTKTEIISFAREAEKLVQAQILKVSAGYAAALRSDLGKDKKVELWGPRHQRAGVPRPKSGVVRFVGTDESATAGVKNELSALVRKYARYDITFRDDTIMITVARCLNCSNISRSYHDPYLQLERPQWPGRYQPWNNRWCYCGIGSESANRGREIAQLWELQRSLERSGAIAEWIRAPRELRVRELQQRLRIYRSARYHPVGFPEMFATYSSSADTWAELAAYVPLDQLSIETVRVHV